MEDMSTSGVRLATMADAGQVGVVNAAAWRSRLKGILPDAVLNSLDPDALGMMWASATLNPPTPRHRVLVAADDGIVLAYAAMGPSADPDADASTVELLALEVDPGHQRQGHGSRLMAAVVELARDEGQEVITTWCPVADEVRREFLQSAGWGPDSARRDLQVGPGDEDVLREARLVAGI